MKSSLASPGVQGVRHITLCPAVKNSKCISWCFFALLLFATLAISGQSSPAGPSAGSDIIQYLNENITWYRHLATEREIATEPSDILVVNNNRAVADQVIRLGFEYARAQAESLAKQPATQASDAKSPPSQQYQALYRLSTKLDTQLRDTQSELDSLRQKLEKSTGQSRKALQAQLSELQSELELTQARRDAMRTMTEFVSGSNTSGLGAGGLRAQIEALARSLPGDLTSSQGSDSVHSSSPDALGTASAISRSEPSGIWGLIADLFRLSRKSRAIEGVIRQTDELNQQCKQLRAPLVDQLKELSQKGDSIATQADSSTAAELLQQKSDLDALTAQFKQISVVLLPLRKQGVLLGVYKNSLGNWQNTIQRDYRAELWDLLFRLAFLGGMLALVFGFGELWRRTILRYVHDPRRRYQFLLIRKIVVWFSVALVVAFAFASQIGSVATFAGLITAGVAVALQNVILSVAGYFFLIGKYGIRVGDRVQIAGVTGEVVDIGLVRLHLLELGSGGVELPSGRVVAFSNSIVFQPTSGLFKQIPGTNFVWHEITLTLTPDSDYHTIEEELRATIDKLFSEFRDEMERQRQLMERTLSSTSVIALQPRLRLRFLPAAIEATVRFPVSIQNASEIDDRFMRELLNTINQSPKMKLVGSGGPGIALKTDVTAAAPPKPGT